MSRAIIFGIPVNKGCLNFQRSGFYLFKSLKISKNTPLRSKRHHQSLLLSLFWSPVLIREPAEESKMQSIFDLRELKIDLDYGLPNVGQIAWFKHWLWLHKWFMLYLKAIIQQSWNLTFGFDEPLGIIFHPNLVRSLTWWYYQGDRKKGVR